MYAFKAEEPRPTKRERGRPPKCDVKVLGAISLKLHDNTLTLHEAVDTVNDAFKSIPNVSEEELCVKTLRNRCKALFGTSWRMINSDPTAIDTMDTMLKELNLEFLKPKQKEEQTQEQKHEEEEEQQQFSFPGLEYSYRTPKLFDFPPLCESPLIESGELLLPPNSPSFSLMF